MDFGYGKARLTRSICSFVQLFLSCVACPGNIDLCISSCLLANLDVDCFAAFGGISCFFVLSYLGPPLYSPQLPLYPQPPLLIPQNPQIPTNPLPRTFPGLPLPYHRYLPYTLPCRHTHAQQFSQSSCYHFMNPPFFFDCCATG